MTTVDSQPSSPASWATEPEQRYARRQSALADRYDVAVESRTVETDAAGQIHYLVAGDPDGQPVVLLHGVSTTAATWLPMVPALTDDYRVYIPDRPGRGLSAAPSYRGRNLRWFMVGYLVELFDELGLDQAHVVGNSLGGQQAFLLALDTDCVDRLCLVGAPGGLSREFALAFRLLTVRGLNRLLFWLNGLGDPFETAQQQTEQTLVADNSAVSTEFYELLAASSEMPDRQRSLRSLQSAQGSFGRMHELFDLREEVVDIDRPTGFVWGSEDSFWEPAVGRPVAEQMGAEFHELTDHGHMPWLEPGEQTETAVRSFLDG
ncbi:Pimeloyl-ACP methyl ester carboxylesterase [Halovenus aranensis]|uniref:Pimeloyl-ACP methyl ester carboxylesterase n=1 Tax=Halovenus aranensis TaxID=890420 RepID=A0A1G8X2G5_9EURY|nr:alpha/beta hydrolase [Halovenus aranensis]SDJ84838.1 Pimeloyl-ACP methyl ester carboxylesterase [Halovenus aranensis]